MVEQPPRCGNHHVGTHFQAALLAGERGAVGTAVYGQRADWQEVGKPLHLPVDLLCQFACRRHNQAVYRIVWEAPVGQAVDYGEKIGCGFAGACLCAGYKVAPFENNRDCLFLNRGAFVKSHRIECVEHFVA